MRAYTIALLLAACASETTTSSTDSPSAACREVAKNELPTRFVVTGLGPFEGNTIHAMSSVKTINNIECRAAARADIVENRAEVRVENLRDDAVYPRVGAWIDVDGDGVCIGEVDLVWTEIWTAPPPGVEVTVTLIGDQFAFRPDDEGCALL